jgi:hypothetical protein
MSSLFDRLRHTFGYACQALCDELSQIHQYTRFFGLIYSTSSVSVYSCTGR